MDEARRDVSRRGELDVGDLHVPDADVYLVGYGNKVPNDFTLEMLAVLKRCRRVFGAPPVHAPQLGLPEMENLLLRYRPDTSRRETYGEWLELVLEAAAADPPVAFATYGSTMVGAFVAHRILEEAPPRGLTVHVTNAVSCFDGIWADFNVDPFYGFEIWEATAFVAQDVAPNTMAHLVLPQAPVFEVAEGPNMARLTMALSSTTSALRDHLLRFYPADHEVHYVRTGFGAGPGAMAPDVETVRLADLDHPGRNQAATLLVPGLGRPPSFDFRRPHGAPRATPAG